VEMKAGVEGFEFAAASCGLKEDGELDMALILSRASAACAGVFTTNRFAAAPVLLGRQRLKAGRARAVLVNSGCANACTGERGYQDAVESARWLARALEVPEEEVLVASTGVIGTYLPMERIRKGIQALVRERSCEGLPRVARAIMTTDTRPKWTVRRIEVEGRTITLAAVAKGAGMIHPRMATMLCFVVTDASVSSSTLQSALEEAVETSFHRITVDGDTSTNDTVLILANGAAGGAPLEEERQHLEAFRASLCEVLQEMALAIVDDAEGRTKVVRLVVEGALDDYCADRVARTVAHSLLVKTALYGGDVNWGRILAAVGYSGVEVDPERVDLWYGPVQLVRSGRGLGEEAERAAEEIVKKERFDIRISLGEGKGSAVLHTCDLSHDYVSINASYRT